MTRLALRVLIGSVAASAILGVYALLVGQFGEFEGRILATAGTVSGTCILFMACGVAWERRRLGGLPATGAILSVATCLLVLIGIWGEIGKIDYWKLVGSVAIAASACAHMSLMALARLAPRYSWSLRGAYALAVLLALSLILAIWVELEEDFAWRLIGVVSVLLSAVTVAVPVFHRMSRPEGEPESGPRAARFCPACGARLGEAAQAAPCPDCGARFSVEFSN